VSHQERGYRQDGEGDRESHRNQSIGMHTVLASRRGHNSDTKDGRGSTRYEWAF
jgi:hypothetical protein